MKVGSVDRGFNDPDRNLEFLGGIERDEVTFKKELVLNLQSLPGNPPLF
jgi:hypothetical protein